MPAVRLQMNSVLRKSNSGRLSARTCEISTDVDSTAQSRLSNTYFREAMQALDRLPARYVARLRSAAGRSEAWLSRLLWGQETAGSNPAAPIFSRIGLAFSGVEKGWSGDRSV